MPKRLTDLSVDKLKPHSTKRAYISDPSYKGLYLVVFPSGKKSWVVARRLDGKLVKVKIGSFPAFNVEQARQEATRYLQAFDKQEDPREIRRAEHTARQNAKADTIAIVGQEWLKRDQADKRTVGEIERFLNRRLLPAWGDRLVSAITKKDCIAFVNKVADETSVIRSRRIHCILHRFFQWCLEQDILVLNPMNGMKKLGEENIRQRVLNDEELAEAWKATDKVDDAGLNIWGPIFKLLILTGARREEIGGLRWDEVQLENRILLLPGHRTKRLPKHKDKPRTIYLSQMAASIIKSQPRFAGSPFVFTTTGTSPVSGWGRAKERMDKLVNEGLGKEIDHWRIHDLRKTLATGFQRIGVRLEVTENVLGHLSGSRQGIVGVYQLYDFKKESKEAVELWSDHVTQLCALKNLERSDVTLPLAKIS